MLLLEENDYFSSDVFGRGEMASPSRFHSWRSSGGDLRILQARAFTHGRCRRKYDRGD
jgi:hypothetical protein